MQIGKTKINPVIAIMLAIILVLGGMFWYFSKKTQEPTGEGGYKTVKPTVTPTFIPLPPGGNGPDASGAVELQREATQTQKMYPLFEKLPYTKGGVKISHYYKPLNLAVYVDLKQTSKEEAAKIVDDFLKANGFSPTSHEIDWRYQNQ